MKIFYLYILSFFIVLNVFSQKNKELVFTKISLEQGLSQSVINCILQDKQGFIWFGTQDGLNKFDGYEFKVYRNDFSDSLSISNNFINNIYQDKSGNLWISTKNGLSYYNVFTDKFKQYFHNIKNKNSLAQNIVFKTMEDRKGNLWVTTSISLSKFNSKNGSFQNYYFDTLINNYDNYDKFPIIEDHAGYLWVGTRKGIKIFNTNTNKFIKNNESLSRLKDEIIYSIHQDVFGIFWIGTNKGLYEYNLISGLLLKINNRLNSFSFFDNGVNTILSEDNENLWIGTKNKGLVKYNRNKSKYDLYTYDAEDESSLSHNNVLSLHIDNTGSLWIGTMGGGINKIDYKAKKFEYFTPFSKQDNLISKNVSSIACNNKGKIWIGTWGNGLICKNISDNKIIKILNDNDNNLISGYINSLVFDNRDNLWIGTDKGLTCLNTVTYEAKHYIHNENDNTSLCDNNIKTLYFDKSGYIWVGTTNGLSRLNRRTHKFKNFHNKSTNTNSINSNLIYAIEEDSQGEIWIGTDGGGLNKYNPNLVRFHNYYKKDGSKSIVDESIVLSIKSYNDSIIFIGTTDGLFKLNKQTNSVKKYTTKNGLCNNVIYSIIKDFSNNIWLSTNYGISKMNFEKETFQNYDISDGLQNYEFNRGASATDKDSTFYFGGINGYNAFKEKNIIENVYIPPIVITSFKLFNSEIKLDSSISKKTVLYLSHNDVFSFEFAALNFTHPNKNNYAYKLEGADNDWIYCGNRRYVNYNKLQPGTYIFNVKGSNNDLVWNEDGASIKIIIKPPFYETKWFIVLVILAFALLIKFFIDLRTNSLKKKNKILQEKEIIAMKVAEQKEQLSIFNKSIIDSMNYAKRLQKGILPNNNNLKQYFSDSFIYLNSKEIVSGDFPWFRVKNNIIYVAAIDCTGHGVPGAIMSIAGNFLLNQSLTEHNLTRPDEILNDLNKGVINAFNTTKDNIKDGMDISLCAIDLERMTLEYAGAYSPIYVFKNNVLNEIKGNRFPVGLFKDTDFQGFNNYKIPINKGDKIYLFTDGYADQFGGGNNKKFKYQRFRDLLINIQNLSMQEQETFINKTFINWKGMEDQVDDILIIGIKI